MSPVTRVVELLQGISTQIEQEHKAEEDLYETFVCWAKSMIGQKTDSNAAATAKIESLETYLKDLAAGRIELTSERADLEKEIETLRGDMEVASELRKKETAEYDDAKAEMDQAITALASALEVLQEATTNKTGALLSVRSSLNAGMAARAAESASLNLAVSLGHKMLTPGDAIFLQRLLTGEVPNPDWKKLNRKATFKMSYKARSEKIEGVLQKMLDTFKANLAEATKKEEDAQALYDKMKEAKGAELQAALDALTKMEKETGARGLSKEEAQEEVDALKKQVVDDTKYIKQVEDALATKKTEWKDRKELRAGELEAISKAISVLHSDDARDLFKRSFKSQGALLFLQEGRSLRRVAAHARSASAGRAAAVLRATGSAALANLVSKLGDAAPAHFAKVIEAIDKMIATLGEQETTDLKNKESCEKARVDDTREAITISRAVDELSETVMRLKAEIEELQAQIEEKKEEIKETQEMLKEAKQNREDENKEWTASDKDDEDAAALIKDATAVLEEFYSKLALVQRRDPPEAVAGEAPPPPPSTWEGGYMGKKDEEGGIVAILALVREDIIKDRATAKQAEDDAEAKYQKMKTEAEAQVKTLEGEITEMEGSIGSKEADVEAAETDISGKKDELGVVMKRIKDAQPGCDFVTVNFETRLKARQVEKDGLVEAKAILSGAKFDESP